MARAAIPRSSARTAGAAPGGEGGAPTNAPELTVSELSGALKRAIEDRFGLVRLRGEVSGWRGPHSSGHCYFSLKDEGARIDAVMWRTTYQRLRIKPEEGMEVIATGKVTTYPGKSSYQIVVEAIEPAGVGALLAQLEERRRRLAAEGLFDAARKKPLPYLPRVIAVVTSPTGAVIRDILHRLADRFPSHVLVWPVRVQGETSAAEVAAAVTGLNALTPGGALPRPDVIIVARGGGSLEDLWGFNDEALARAVAAGAIPLVSAVGHETDTTLIDHVADLRAPTPTAAAEMIVPVRADLLASLAALAARKVNARARFFERRVADLRALTRALPSGEALLANPRQRFDRAADRLLAQRDASLRERHMRLARAAAALARHSPQAELATRRARLESLRERWRRVQPALAQRPREKLGAEMRALTAAMQARVAAARHAMRANAETLRALDARRLRGWAGAQETRRASLGALAAVLRSLGYENVLARGFALVRDGDGAPIRSLAQTFDGQALTIDVADGRFGARVTGAPAAIARDTAAPREKPTRRQRASDKDQGSLF